MKRELVLISAAALLAASLSASADQGNGNGKGKGRRGPPPQALEACEAMVEGDACSFTSRRGDAISGTCAVPRGDQLVCFPEGGPPGRNRDGDRNRDDNSTEDDQA